MDQPDDIEATAASASVLVRHRLGRVQATPSDTALARRVGGSLSGPNHRVSADCSCPFPFVVVLRLRTLWPRKRELCRARCLVHSVIVLCYCWNAGRILRQHARDNRSLPLPNMPAPIFEVSLDCEIWRIVCPVHCALSNTPLDLGPHNCCLSGFRVLDMEGNGLFGPSEVDDWDHR